MNGNAPLSGSFHPEPSCYPGHKLLTTRRTADAQPRVSPPHSHQLYNLNLPRHSCSSGSKPISLNFALDCKECPTQRNENSSNGSTITTTMLHISQSNADGTEPPCLSPAKPFTEFPEDNKTPTDKKRAENVTFEDAKGTWLLEKQGRRTLTQNTKSWNRRKIF